MENCENLKNKLRELEGKTFKTNKQGGHSFTVTDTQFHMGKFYLYTASRTFVQTETEFKAFLDTITVLDEGVVTKAAFVPNKDIKTLKNLSMEHSPEVITAVTTITQNAVTISNGLMDMFNTMSKTPTEEDFKKAEAMSKLSNSYNSVVQTQINLLNLKNKRS